MQKYFSPTREGSRKFLENYLEKYPENEVVTIGKSILNSPLECYKFGVGKRHILAVGAHHAVEHITASALYNFIDFLAENAKKNATVFGVNLPFFLEKYTL